MKYSAEDCIRLLREKAAALKNEGVTRYPSRSDFDETEVAAIKSFFGPWPRALEAAGVKPVRDDGIEARRLEKRIRAKRRRTAAKKQKLEETQDEKQTESQH